MREARPVGVLAVLVALALFGPAVAAAQDSRGYVDGAFLFSAQGASTPRDDPDTFKPGVGGNAVGLVGSVGVFLSPRISLAFEMSWPARFDALQTIGYFQPAQLDNRHRDEILSGLIHVHLSPIKGLRPELVAGGGYVREDTLQRRAYDVGGPLRPTGVYGPYGPETSVTRDALGATIGADLGVRIGAHLSVVPQVRVHWIPREDTASGSLNSFLYLSPFVFRPAVGIRAGF
jgi:hypothetical protein